MTATPEHPVILFDGVCNLCNHSVNFIIDRDPQARFRFAALQSPAAQALLAARGLPPPAAEPESILLLAGDKVHQRSGAALRIARGLRGAWPLLSAFLLVPAPLRDWVYRWIARNRYRWFGKSDTCRMPTPELKARFL